MRCPEGPREACFSCVSASLRAGFSLSKGNPSWQQRAEREGSGRKGTFQQARFGPVSESSLGLHRTITFPPFRSTSQLFCAVLNQDSGFPLLGEAEGLAPGLPSLPHPTAPTQKPLISLHGLLGPALLAPASLLAQLPSPQLCLPSFSPFPDLLLPSPTAPPPSSSCLTLSLVSPSC